MKFTYVTKVDKKGNIMRYRRCIQYFTDGDTGVKFPVPRHKLIKVNGVKVQFYPMSQIKAMSAAERESIKLPLK